jgi:hypothetical protein
VVPADNAAVPNVVAQVIEDGVTVVTGAADAVTIAGVVSVQLL